MPASGEHAQELDELLSSLPTADEALAELESFPTLDELLDGLALEDD